MSPKTINGLPSVELLKIECNIFFSFVEVYYNLRKFSFTNRIVNIWNSLHNAVVDVNSVDAFKSRLDNFWKIQDVKFEYTADLTGTGDRSEFDT